MLPLRYLAHREKVLLRRRQTAEAALRQQEKLLKRERMLDREEESVARLVGKALRSFELKLGGHRKTKRRAGEADALGDEGSGEEARVDNRRPETSATAPSPLPSGGAIKDNTSVGHSVASKGQSQTYPKVSVHEELSHTHIDEELSHTHIDEELGHTHIDEELSHTHIDEELSHTQDRIDEELSHTQDHIHEELSGLPEEQVTHPEEQVEEDLSHSKRGNTDEDVVVTQLDHTSPSTHSASTRQRPTQTSQAHANSEYNGDTFESFHPSSAPRLASTPSQQRFPAEEETLNVAPSISGKGFFKYSIIWSVLLSSLFPNPNSFHPTTFMMLSPTPLGSSRRYCFWS